MKDIRRLLALTFLIGPLIGLYRTFVLQNLWNWFATEALHLPVISFWVMYGLVLIIGILTADYSDKQQEHAFKTFGILLDACVPDDKKEWVREQLDDVQENIWVDVGFMVFGGILDVTVALVLGWAVHAFLL
jgi:hypothetical protein